MGVPAGRMVLAKVVKEERAVLLGAASGGAVRAGPGGVVSVEARAGGVVKAGAGEATVERPRERAALKAPPAPAITFPTNYWTSSSEGFWQKYYMGPMKKLVFRFLYISGFS